MKKLISLTLVLVMVFAFAAVSCYAAESPAGAYVINAGAEGKGTASSDTSKIEVKEDGTVTLTAVENGGYFTMWIINGEYEVVSGDIYSPTLVIKPASNITAIASFREDKDNYTISINVVGDGTATANPEKVKVGSGDTVTLTAVDGKDKFAGWTLECDYEIVSGDLTSKTLVIKPNTDVKVTATFNADGKAVKTTTTTSDTSPKTGDPTFAVIAIVLMTMFGAAFAVKKIKE